MRTNGMVVLLLAVLALACRSSTPAGDGGAAVAAAGAPLEGTRWVLVSLAGQPVAASTPEREPYLELDAAEHRAQGNASCNRFGGPYTSGPDTLRFGALVSTKMACADETLNAQEVAYLSALDATRRWRITGDTLVLDGESGEVARFTAATERAAAGGRGAGRRTVAPATFGDTVVSLEPTGAGQLPAAVLGTAPPPEGAPLQYFTGHPSTRGYLALPRGEGPHPAVILIHEWNGLDERVRQVADALAAEGYVALAADLFSGKMGKTPEENRALIAEAMADERTVIGNLDAAAAYLRGRPDVTGKIVTMGWCFGGGVALSYGIEGEHHEGTAMFYGGLVQDPEQLKRMRHPLYGTFAGLDDGIPPAEVERFVSALRTAGIENDVHVYDAVEHGFWLWVDEDPATRTQPATDAWERLKGWLKTTLG